MFYGVSVQKNTHAYKKRHSTFIALWPLKTLLDSYAMQHHHLAMPVRREDACRSQRQRAHPAYTRFSLHSAYKMTPLPSFISFFKH